MPGAELGEHRTCGAGGHQHRLRHRRGWTYLPEEKLLRWSYAGHPPALTIGEGRELVAPRQGDPLGLGEDPEYVAGSLTSESSTGVLLTRTA